LCISDSQAPNDGFVERLTTNPALFAQIVEAGFRFVAVENKSRAWNFEVTASGLAPLPEDPATVAQLLNEISSTQPDKPVQQEATANPLTRYPSGLYRIGGGVTAPIPIVSPEAEFSDEARSAKYQGVCLVSVIVDAEGNPQNPRVIRHLDYGLDEKAVEAVSKYKFKPALKDGVTPVPVMITIEVNFRLY
jgi:TonB family protein